MAINNNKVISDGLIKARKIIDDRMLVALRETAWDLTNATEVPIWTHNLWDSIGCGIFKDGVLMEVTYPPKKAEEPRTDIYGINVPKRDYWGIEELKDTVTSYTPTSDGWVLYYVAAMPYSELVDDRSDADVLQEELVKPTFLSHVRRV